MGVQADGLSFEEGEIEDLVEEVEESGEVPLQADDVDWLPPRHEETIASRGQRPPLVPAPAVTAPPRAAEEGPFARLEPQRAVAEPPAARKAAPDEIQIEIVDEEEPRPPAWAPAAERFVAQPPETHEPKFEVDLGFDPAWQPEDSSGTGEGVVPQVSADGGEDLAEPDIVLEPIETAPVADVADDLEAERVPVETRSEATPIPVNEADEAGAPAESATVVLEEIAEERQLFEDPDLEVARLAAGEARDIVVPVEIAEGSVVRRFRLTLRLRLDPLE